METNTMATTYHVRNPDDVMRARQQSGVENWVETTMRSVAESIEDYARHNPLSCAAWAFGIGFVLGWKLKLW
jgi:hypothetical protein